MKIFADGLGTPEGPVFLDDGSLLVVELARTRGCVTRISKDGKAKNVIARTGRPNGLALDRTGAVWVAETALRAVLRMTLDGCYDIVAQGGSGVDFLFPNDLAFSPNGDLYLTDSGVALEDFEPAGTLAPNFRSLQYDGRLFRIRADTKEVELIDRGLMFANGLAFGPDGNLYVAESLTGAIYRYLCVGGQPNSPRELFGNVADPACAAELKAPDGMKFGADGLLYVAVFGQGDVTLLGKDGRVVERLKTAGRFPSNLVFGLHDGLLYVTEGETGTVQTFEVQTHGYVLHG